MQQPSKTKESSVLFSLSELMQLEKERERREREEAEKQAENEAKLAEERAVQEREEAARAASAREEEARIHAQREREERARLDAIRDAEMERARAQAENEARLRELASAQRHERELAEIGASRKHRRAKIFAMILSVLIAACVAIAVVIVWQKEKQAQALRDQIAAMETEQQRLHRELAQASSPAERDSLLQRIADLDRKTRDLKTEKAPLNNAPKTQKTAPPSNAQGPKAADPCEEMRKIRQSDPHDPRLYDPANPCLD